jgi:hypothetical protein
MAIHDILNEQFRSDCWPKSVQLAAFIMVEITGKTLMIQNLMDYDSVAWIADWYRSKVKAANNEDKFALIYLEHSQHENPVTTRANAFHVPYHGAIIQGLPDLAAWVEKGEKPNETKYKVVNQRVEVSTTANERGGIQPVVELAVNGKLRAEANVGETVKFTAKFEVPTEMGKIVEARWDYEGVGTLPIFAKLDTPKNKGDIQSNYAYTKPGTYFPVIRVASHRQGNMTSPHARVYNLARARVIVV